MEKEKLESQSSNELRQKIKTIKVIVGMLAGTSILLLVVVLYLLIVKKNNSMLALLVVAFSSIPIILFNLKQAKEMQAELDLREKS